MNVKVHGQHFEVTPALRKFVVDNLEEPLERVWRKDGASLDVELRDLRGGDKHGIGQECRCIFVMPNGRKLVITEVTEDMRTSIHQVRKRLLRRVRQHVEQRLSLSRRPRGSENARSAQL